MSGFDISSTIMGALSLVGAGTIARQGLRYSQVLNSDRLEALLALKAGLKESMENALEKEVYTPIKAQTMKNDITHWAMQLDQFQKEFKRSSRLNYLKDRAALQELEARALNYSNDMEAATGDYLHTLPANLTPEQRVESAQWYHGVRNMFRGYRAFVANMPWLVSVEATSESETPGGQLGTNILPLHTADLEVERPEVVPGAHNTQCAPAAIS